ncbi:MAG: hypothetical protein ACRDHZ_03905 [Ktedonobacteraceae bacterium]
MSTNLLSAKAVSFPDFTVQNEGSIVLLHPHTDAARSWVDENIGEDNGYQPMWPTVVVEHRFIADIVNGIQMDELEVR